MASKSIAFILMALAVAAQASLVPVKASKVDNPELVSKSYTLTGSSGSFSYPVNGGTYGTYENVFFQLHVDQLTVFTIESYDTESADDELTIYNSESNALSKPVQVSGKSTAPTYYQVASDVFGYFTSDFDIQKTGFTVSWGPLNTFNGSFQDSMVPVKVPKLGNSQQVTKSYTLTGSSGSFSYPVNGGTYGTYENVFFQLHVDQLTVFTIERYDTESVLDELTIYNSENNALSKPVQVSGKSTAPKYYQVTSDVLGHFESDGSIQKTGFKVTWGPLNTAA